jgi:hypothetical protein
LNFGFHEREEKEKSKGLRKENGEKKKNDIEKRKIIIRA